MIAKCLAFALGHVAAVRVDLNWSKISTEDYPHSYRDALDAFRVIALPQWNVARAQCGMEGLIDFSASLARLLLVESSEASYRLTFNSADLQSQNMVVTIDKARGLWSAVPRPCELASIGLDVAIPLSEDDILVREALQTLTEITAAKCSREEVFVPISILDAVLFEGTRNEQVELHLLGPAGPHRVLFEFSGAKARLVSSHVPVCDLVRAPSFDSSIIQLWGGLSPSEVRAMRVRRVTSDIYEKARTAKIAQARLPSYTGQLEAEFHWAEAVPECFGFGPEVQDQGSCGACWAFAILGALGDRYCLAYGKRNMSGPDGRLERFSVQDLLSCHLVDGDQDGCKGGTLENGVKAAMRKQLSFERESPFFAKCYVVDLGPDTIVNEATEHGNCSEYRHLPDHPANAKPCSCWSARPQAQPMCDENVPRRNVQVDWGSIQAIGDLSLPKRVELIMRYIREGGPVAAAFAVYDDFRPLVAKAPDMPYRRHDSNAKWRGGHAAVLTGWGVSKEGKHYWWARNSWGTAWGKQGYFKIARGSNSAGIEEQVFFPLVKDGFIDAELHPRQAVERSYSSFGIRLPWSNEFVPNWGQILSEQLSEQRQYTYVPSDVNVEPIIATFQTGEAQIKMDVYSGGAAAIGLRPGRFHLLAVEIRFECSEPCVIQSFDRYEVVDDAGATVETYRVVTMQLDDDSWSRGLLTVYIGKDDPLQGRSQSEIKVTVESPLREQITDQMSTQGVDLFEIKNWYQISKRERDYTISLPPIPLHREPKPPLEPILPLNLSMRIEIVDLRRYRSLKLLLDASEPSVFYVRVLTNDTNEVLLASAIEQPPSWFAFPRIGGIVTLGGASYESFFHPEGKGYAKILSIEVEAVCNMYAAPVRTTVRADFRWPESNESGRSLLPPLNVASVGDVFDGIKLENKTDIALGWRLDGDPTNDQVILSLLDEPRSFPLGLRDFLLLDEPRYYAEQLVLISSNFRPSRVKLPDVLVSCKPRSTCKQGYQGNTTAKDYWVCSYPNLQRNAYELRIPVRLYDANCSFDACSLQARVYHSTSELEHRSAIVMLSS